MVKTLEAKVGASLSDVKAAIADLGRAAAERDAKATETAAAREGRFLMWVVVTVGVATAILGALMGFLALFPRGG